MKKKILQLSAIFLLTLSVVGVYTSQVNAQTTASNVAVDTVANAVIPGGGLITAGVRTALDSTGESPGAAVVVTKLLGIDGFIELITKFVANLSLLAAAAMGFVLALSGALLNFSISLTLHIKEYVNSTPVIYTTWRSIRDISGIFMIFILLYAAIQLILNIKSNNFNKIIKDIVVIGLLINFSFFFAGLGIDASNIVSIQLYNAIAPANSLNAASATYNNAQSGTFSSIDGGISDIFMQSLKIQTSQIKGVTAGASDGLSSDVNTIIGNLVTVMIELIAALSFTAASFAFVFRFVILLILLAFSPIWILGIGGIIPKIGEYSSRWTKHYLAMLQFMPVYLLLMYLAMSILSANQNGLFTAASVGNAWYGQFIALGVNAFLVCFMINLPLVVAIGMGDMATSFLKKLPITADKLWKGFGSQVGSRIPGRMAYNLNNSKYMNKLASSSPLLGQLASSGLSKVSTSGFGGGKSGGYEARLSAKKKAQDAMYKRLGTVDRGEYATEEEYKKALELARGKKLNRNDAEYKNMTDEEFSKAQKKVRGYQAAYRENLPWTSAFTGKPGGTIGFFVDNRANMQTSAKLIEEARKKGLKGKKKGTKDSLDSEQQELKEIKEEIARQGMEKRVGFSVTPGKPATQAQLDRIESLGKSIASKQKELEEIDEVEEEERADKIAKKVADNSKKDDADKPEKKESGGEEKKTT